MMPAQDTQGKIDLRVATREKSIHHRRQKRIRLFFGCEACHQPRVTEIR
jgi:hypothetical protein